MIAPVQEEGHDLIQVGTELLPALPVENCDMIVLLLEHGNNVFRRGVRAIIMGVVVIVVGIGCESVRCDGWLRAFSFW